jgi:hypothetical protein
MSLPPPSPSLTVAEVGRALTAHGYLPDQGLTTAVYLALSLRRPLLLEGEAGVGKTEVAKVLSRWTGGELIRLQCYEGIDASQAVYDWDYSRQLLHLRAAEASGEATRPQHRRPGGRALPGALPREAAADARHRRPPRGPPPVLLIDEIDRADDEFEAYLLEVLSDYQVTVPELGVFRAPRPRSWSSPPTGPATCTTHSSGVASTTGSSTRSSNARSRSSAAGPRQVSRRPGPPGLRGGRGAAQLHLYKPPGVAETIDWATALGLLGVGQLDDDTVAATLGTVLKYREDQERVRQHGIDRPGRSRRSSAGTPCHEPVPCRRLAARGVGAERIAVGFARVLRGAGLSPSRWAPS